MKFLFAVLLTMPLIAVAGHPARACSSATIRTQSQPINLQGRWRVKLVMSGVEKNLVFDAKPKGLGSFLLLDAGPDDKPVTTPLPGAWSHLSHDRVSFSLEAELPIGTCCREIGTLTLKGKFTSSSSIAGKLIFITSVEEDESPYQFRSLVGTFTATRIN